MTQQESDSLNLIRWLSTIAIVTCHILQGFDHLYAWIFNLGVQVFFFLSGFLYGNKRIINAKTFYRKRFVKLYLPYCIWVIVAMCLIFCFSPYSIGYKDIFLQLAMLKNLSGLDHLWFMPVIFLCYLFLPFVDKCLSKNTTLSLIIFGFLTVLVLISKYSPTFLWVALYYVGYLCGRFSKIQKYVLTISAVATIWILYYCDFNLCVFKESTVRNNLLHAFSGTLIFLGLYIVSKIINISSKISHILTIRGV